MRRVRVAEVMDAPGLDPAEHAEALRGLARINRASRTATALWGVIGAWAKRRNVSQFTMVDVACGGGDVPIGIALAARDAGVTATLTLMDRSVVALAHAQAGAERAGIHVRTIVADAMALDGSDTFDVVSNSLFLHHLDRSDAVRALHQMAAAAAVGGVVVVSDLRRSLLGWVIAWIGCRVLSRSRVVHFDGPVSVRAAWTVAELRTMAVEAGMRDANVFGVWPWRMMLVWERGS
jgi:2-polyprenyl-3-methyl-5-hydroxy-6-metoxy-1,4-benzoquinol methylase